VICFGIFLKKVFFGQLRSIEYEVSDVVSHKNILAMLLCGLNEGLYLASVRAVMAVSDGVVASSHYVPVSLSILVVGYSHVRVLGKLI